MRLFLFTRIVSLFRMVRLKRSLFLIFLLFLVLTETTYGLPSLSEIKEKLKGSDAYSEKEFEAMALKLRQQAIESTRYPRVETHPSFLSGQGFNRYPWKYNIFTTVFWIGERPTAHNPVPNNISAFDAHWFAHFGGYDNPNPTARHNFIPKAFVPKQNPFYCALPYNDIARGHTKPEVRSIVPWFKETFLKSGQSILKGRWIAIHHAGRTCFAQWEDCGPFRTDHAGYVFGNERPRPNLNHGAGLDISPAVRDYLGMQKNEFCDWKFVDASAVPDGPWKLYGNNNTFWLLRSGKDLVTLDPNNARRAAAVSGATALKPSQTTVGLKNNPVGARITPSLREN